MTRMNANRKTARNGGFTTAQIRGWGKWMRLGFEVPPRLRGGAAFLGFASIRVIRGQKILARCLVMRTPKLARATRAVPYGEGEAPSSSDMGITPGIMPGEASNIPVLLSGCRAARTWKVRFSSPRITVTGTTSPAVT